MKKRTLKYLGFFSKLLYLKSLIPQFNLQDARGNDVELSRYKGKVLLIVNVASQWLKFLSSFPVL
jgi:cytochrome oxidase Cu insertion factor (SCO1/SenC/PrrC family)